MPATARKISFRGGGDFANNVRSDVDAYLALSGVKEGAFRKLHRKAAIIVAWVACSYVALVFLPHSLAQIAVCGASMVLAMAALEFNVMHDGNHGSFSANPRINFIAGLALEFAGAVSGFWKTKHNVSHHGYPNVVEYDDDIEQPPFARFACAQEWRPWHRWQHIYLWPIYGFAMFRWMLIGDMSTIRRGRVTQFPVKKLDRSGWIGFYTTKLFAWGWQLGLPIALNWSWHGAAIVLLIYVCLLWTFSSLLIITFQLAHCVDETRFVSPQDADENGKMPLEWMVGQVNATQDFCHGRRWRWLTWYLGGLNYQIEHHLFHKIPHTHYPAIAMIVRKSCDDHGIRYVHQPSLSAALGSHQRHLRDMGMKPVP